MTHWSDCRARILDALVDEHGERHRGRPTPGVAAQATGPYLRLMPASVGRPNETREQFAAFAATRDERLRAELVEAHIGLAHQLARRFTNRGESYDDLVQVASLALVKSVDRFDPERGVEFSTFATRTVIGELKRHFRDRGWAIRAPRRIQELYLELGHIIDSLSQELGRPPTVSEMAAATGASRGGRSWRLSRRGRVTAPPRSTLPTGRRGPSPTAWVRSMSALTVPRTACFWSGHCLAYPNASGPSSASASSRD